MKHRSRDLQQVPLRDTESGAEHGVEMRREKGQVKDRQVKVRSGTDRESISRARSLRKRCPGKRLGREVAKEMIRKIRA